MIVQTAAGNSPRFVIRQMDHGRFCGQLARAFGNAQFAPLEPRDLLEYVTEHHDDGWAEFDDAPERDPATGLPRNLDRMPNPARVAIGHASPDLNERYHPYCGLLSSMHYWGVYHDRFGLMPSVSIELMPAEQRPELQAMLDREQARQERLKAALAADPATAPLVETPRLMDNYKTLQFFDLLALYFNLKGESARGEVNFNFVPTGPGHYASVHVQAVEPGIYRLRPYPFREDRLLVDCDGRYISPLAAGEDVPASLRAAPVVQQTFALVAG